MKPEEIFERDRQRVQRQLEEEMHRQEELQYQEEQGQGDWWLQPVTVVLLLLIAIGLLVLWFGILLPGGIR